MIAFLSNSIEIAVSAFATGLLAVFPFLPSSIVTHPEQIMVIGFAGQGLFAMRFIVQWLTSEGQGRSDPIAFGIFHWWYSVVALCGLATGSGNHLWTGLGTVHLFAQFVSNSQVRQKRYVNEFAKKWAKDGNIQRPIDGSSFSNQHFMCRNFADRKWCYSAPAGRASSPRQFM